LVCEAAEPDRHLFSFFVQLANHPPFTPVFQGFDTKYSANSSIMKMLLGRIVLIIHNLRAEGEENGKLHHVRFRDRGVNSRLFSEGGIA
jgi:hypothetical protein